MKKYIDIVRELKNELGSRGHDLDHINRVYNMAVRLGNEKSKSESINMEVLELAAILHDIGRRKEDEDESGTIDHAIIGADMAENILCRYNYDNDTIRAVGECIRTHRFRNNNEPKSIEAKILFDADKLDSIGAIGIARCFYVSSQFDQMIYNDMEPEEYFEKNIYDGKKYRDRKLHSPNMEYEFKLKKLKNRLFTKEAIMIAEGRDIFMKGFFEQIAREVRGEE